MKPRTLVTREYLRIVFAGLLIGGVEPSLAAESTAPSAAERQQAEQLIKTHRCDGSCHQTKVQDTLFSDDPNDLYRHAGRRINSWSALKTQVQYCATSLNLPWFPEEINAVAKLLAHDYYRFSTDKGH